MNFWEVLFSYFILKTIKQTQKSAAIAMVDSDNGPQRPSSLRDFLETVKAKKESTEPDKGPKLTASMQK